MSRRASGARSANEGRAKNEKPSRSLIRSGSAGQSAGCTSEQLLRPQPARSMCSTAKAVLEGPRCFHSYFGLWGESCRSWRLLGVWPGSRTAKPPMSTSHSREVQREVAPERPGSPRRDSTPLVIGERPRARSAQEPQSTFAGRLPVLLAPPC